MADEYWTPAFHLMLEEARRSIDRQSERVQNVRERAVGLVGFGSLVAAALGLGSDPRLGVAGVLGVVAFVLVAASALFVLYPREFRFELSARRMHPWLELTETKTIGLSYLLYTTAIRHDEHHAFNHQKLKRLQAAIAVGVAALAVETVCPRGSARAVMGHMADDETSPPPPPRMPEPAPDPVVPDIRETPDPSRRPIATEDK